MIVFFFTISDFFTVFLLGGMGVVFVYFLLCYFFRGLLRVYSVWRESLDWKWQLNGQKVQFSHGVFFTAIALFDFSDQVALIAEKSKLPLDTSNNILPD